MRLALLTLALLSGSAAASAQTMPLHQFVERGTKLEKKGLRALFSRGEIGALRDEMMAAGRNVREERLAAEQQGRRGAYCPPAQAQAQPLDARRFLADIRAISATLPRSSTTTDGMRALLAKRYPCPN